MAMIGKIRRNLWLVIILLGLALAAFIIMDVTSANVPGATSDFSVGSINGDKVDWNEFQDAERILYQGSSQNVYAQRDYLWNYFIADRIAKEEADVLGLGVSREELMELQFGARLSPIVQRNFRDPNTGQINRQQLQDIRVQIENGQLDERIFPFWRFQEKEIIKDRLQTKINTLVQKAMFTPTWMVERYHYDNNNKVDFAYVKLPYDDVDDSEISVSDEDIKAYIKENEAKYKTEEETRVIQYTVMHVKPTGQDSALLLEEMTGVRDAFINATDDSAFVEVNLGVMDDAYYKAEDLPAALTDTVFDMPIGSVYGPYIDNNAYNVVKLIDRKQIPDSVRSRHILLRANDLQQAAAAQQAAGVEPVRGRLHLVGRGRVLLLVTDRHGGDLLALLGRHQGHRQADDDHRDDDHDERDCDERGQCSAQPGQPVVGVRQIFVLVLVLVRHEEAVQALG